MITHILFIIIGFVLLIKGADLLVDGASGIAKRFHIPEMVIGLTIVSIGTSLPELFVSTTSAMHNSADMAIGNIIGSNMFNILMIIGVVGVITPLNYNFSYNIQLGILLFAIALLGVFAFTKPKNQMSRANGILYVIMYAAYMALLFIL